MNEQRRQDRLKQIEQLNEQLNTYAKRKAGKPPLALVDPMFTEGLAYVLDMGNKKHGFMNWKNGLKYSDILAATERHLNELKKGNDLDDETTMHHAYHIASNMMYMAWFHRGKHCALLDDRPYSPDCALMSPEGAHRGR